MPSAVEIDKRRRELAAIHIGAEALGLDDETYRDMLAHVAGKRSAGKLDAAGRRRALDYLRTQGAGPKRGFRRAGAVARQATARPSPGVDAAKASFAVGMGEPFPTPQPDWARLPFSPRPWRGPRARLY